jgi:hypothetical protein
LHLYDYLQDLKEIIREREKRHQECAVASSRILKMFDKILDPKEPYKPETLLASIGKVLERERLSRQASELEILNLLSILAMHVDMYRIILDGIKDKLMKSGILEKVKEIDELMEMKEKIDSYLKLVKAKREKQKQEEESRKEYLSYVD